MGVTAGPVVAAVLLTIMRRQLCLVRSYVAMRRRKAVRSTAAAVAASKGPGRAPM